MKRKSSIHIEAGKLGYCFHNDRSKPTANSIFTGEKNEVDRPAIEAVEVYRQELQKRTAAYTERTGRKLHKKTITHLSAVVNLDDRHRLEDVKRIADYLEQTLGTKVFQIAVHKDEGHIENGEPRINYHAHIEMLGLDDQGQSVRRKLTKRYLIDLQSQVAEILQMQRGHNYTKERKKRPKRLNTYEYKEHAKRQADAIKPLKQDLAKVKDLKEENRRIREELKQAHAKREHYAELEAEVKELKEKIKAKELTINELQEAMAAKERKLMARIDSLEDEVGELIDETDAKNKMVNDLQINLLNLKNSYNSLYEQKQQEIEKLKKEKEEEKKRRKNAELEAEKWRNEAYGEFTDDNGRLSRIKWQKVANRAIKLFNETKEKLEKEQKRRREVEQAAAYQPTEEIEELEAENKELRTEILELKQENIKLKEYIYEIAKSAGVRIMDTVENVVKNTVSSIKSLFSRVNILETEKQELEEKIEELDGGGYSRGFRF